MHRLILSLLLIMVRQLEPPAGAQHLLPPWGRTKALLPLSSLCQAGQLAQPFSVGSSLEDFSYGCL